MPNKNEWQVSIQRIADGRYDDPMALSAVYTKADAQQACAVIGWTVEEEVQASEGLWMCTVSEYAIDVLRREGGLLAITGEYRFDIDAGDVFEEDTNAE